jgi:heme A synthase
MENPWLHRYTVLVAACTALLFINGPVVSTSEERPLYSLGQSHAWLGLVVSILMAGLVFWISRSKEPAWLRWLVWAALGANAVQDLVALETGPVPALVRIAHTVFALLLFSTTVAIAVFTSGSWNQIPKHVQDGSRARSLATTTAALVLLQVILGAAFRHGVTGGLPHILGALVVAVFLGPAMAAILRTETPEVRSAAIALIMLTTVQLLLGFALLTMQSFDDIDPLVVIIATAAHVAIGAFTLAAAVITAILIRRATAKPDP